MKIEKILSTNRLSDGRVRIEYRLSSPITRDVLLSLSQGEWVCSGHQYLSPSFEIIKSDNIGIHGILRSPVIVLFCPPGSQSWIEEYLSGLLSTIEDSEAINSPLQTIITIITSRISPK